MKILKKLTYLLLVGITTFMLFTSQQASIALNAVPNVTEEYTFRKETANYWSGGGIQLEGDLIFEGADDINVYNISDMANPFNVSSMGDIVRNFDFVVEKGYLFTSTSGSEAEVYDISDITNPQLVYTSPAANEGWNYPQIEGNILYSYRGGLNFETRNITDPTSPVILDQFDLFPSLSPFIYDFVVEDAFAYAVWGKNSGEKGLVVLDISDPTNVTLTGSYNDTIVTSGIQYNGITVQNSLAYVAVVGSGIQIFDISDPSKPLPFAQYDEAFYHSMRDIAVYGPYVITAGSFGFRFLDVSDFSNIIKVFSTQGWPTVDEMVIEGNKIYAALSDGGIAIYSIDFDPVTETTTLVTTEITTETSIITEPAISTILVTDTTLITETTVITNQKSEVSFNSSFLLGLPMLLIITIFRRRSRTVET